MGAAIYLNATATAINFVAICLAAYLGKPFPVLNGVAVLCCGFFAYKCWRAR